MGRTYGGILGLIAFLVVLALGRAGGSEATIVMACGCLFLFAAIGWVVGQLANWVVGESVRSKMQAEIDASELARNSGR